jgi:hypothetical protein
MHHSKNRRLMNVLGHHLPRQLTGGAAAVPLRADSKMTERHG